MVKCCMECENVCSFYRSFWVQNELRCVPVKYVILEQIASQLPEILRFLSEKICYVVFPNF